MQEEVHVHAGGKTIGFWGGCQLMINNMAGPAIVLLPALFQEAGFLPVIFVLITAALLSGIGGWMLIESLRLLPGNVNFALHAEYKSVLDYFLPKKIYRPCFVLYLLSLITVLMSNIIQSAQVTDLAFRDLLGCSYGFVINSPFYRSMDASLDGSLDDTSQRRPLIEFICGNENNSNTPFNDHALCVVSSGYLCLGIIAIVFSNKNLDDNIVLQWFANIGLVILVVIWLYIFSQQSTFNVDRIPIATIHFQHVLGVILFNFAFAATLPSWVNEKKSGVSVRKTLLYSIIFILILFSIIGISAGLTYPTMFENNGNLFTALETSGFLARCTVYLFPIIQNVTSIPVFSIIVRYNLVDYGMSRKHANLVAIALPWLLSCFLYTGSGFMELVDWAGIFIASLVNFIIPPYVYIQGLNQFTQSLMKIQSTDEQTSIIQLENQSNTLTLIYNGDDDDTIDINGDNNRTKVSASSAFDLAAIVSGNVSESELIPFMAESRRSIDKENTAELVPFVNDANSNVVSTIDDDGDDDVIEIIDDSERISDNSMGLLASPVRRTAKLVEKRDKSQISSHKVKLGRKWERFVAKWMRKLKWRLRLAYSVIVISMALCAIITIEKIVMRD